MLCSKQSRVYILLTHRPGLLKDHEEFVLFRIEKIPEFKTKLNYMAKNGGICTAEACERKRNELASHPKSAGNRVPISQTNIAFTHKGMFQVISCTGFLRR